MASRGVNKVILVGNVGQDPESRAFANGDSVANITLATSESWKDKSTGQPKEVTEWHRVVFFRKLADIVTQYVKKGSKLYIEGSLKTRSWEQDGVKKYATEIVATEMQMLDGGNSSQNGQESGKFSQAPANNPTAGGSFDDDIPFAQFMRDEF